MNEILDEPSDVANAPTIDDTLKVHMVKRIYNEDGVWKLEFFETCADSDSFHDQWYRRPGDPDVCGHDSLPLIYDMESTCAHCRGLYCAEEEWLMCRVCEQWFHSDWFLL